MACSSIKASILNEEAKVHTIFKGKSLTLDRIENIHEYFIFGFVRNPFDRLVSCYKDKVIRKKERKVPSVFDYYLGGFLMKSDSFSDFVKRIEVIPSHMWEPHFRSQYNIIYENEMGGAKIVPNFIGKFENLENDWRFLQEKFNLGDLPHINATKKDDWRDYYDIKTAKLVYKIYKKDFETFGYEDEYQKLLEYLESKKGNM